MAKAKAAKGAGSVPNKALHSRVSYLYQAAAYLATQQQHSRTSESQDVQPTMPTADSPAESLLQPASRHMISDLRSVSRKLLMRISPAMKNSICKNCDTMLIDGSTCTNEVENKSTGGKKRWADVLVRKCNTCGFEKRFPIGVERQKRRPKRSLEEKVPEKKSGPREEG
ncbi:Rpr2-domain-containing protein [Stipitochalara longipes BDJ]|nr:Rpr2-domain-containing protein [Stipitochalara longipes BDJ]